MFMCILWWFSFFVEVKLIEGIVNFKERYNLFVLEFVVGILVVFIYSSFMGDITFVFGILFKEKLFIVFLELRKF